MSGPIPRPITIPTPVAYDGPRTKYDHHRPTVLGLRAFLAQHRQSFDRWPLTDRVRLSAGLEPIIDAPVPAWRLFGTVVFADPDPFTTINTDRRHHLDITITQPLDEGGFLSKLRATVAANHAADLAHLDAVITAPNPARSVTP